MDPKAPYSPLLTAPGRFTGALEAKLPGQGAWPPLDDHLLEPEGSTLEIIGGVRIETMGSRPEHGDRHFNLDFVVFGHLNDGYVGSTDLTTRSATTSDFATDTCVRRAGTDPTTGERYLEEVAFEVVFTQSATDAGLKAVDLIKRGVRRVFAVFVKKREVAEWLHGRWVTLGPMSSITDSVFAQPLPLRAILDAAKASAAVVRALEAKGDPEVQRIRRDAEQQGEIKGKIEGFRASLRALLAARGFTLTGAQRLVIEGCQDETKLTRWLATVLSAKSTDDVLSA